MERPSDIVLKIVATGKARRCLHYRVRDAFKGMDSHLLHAVRKLDDIGIHVTGQLVRLSETDVQKYPFMTSKIVQRMKGRLLQWDLDFGMTLSRADENFFSVLYPWPCSAPSATGQVIQFPRAAPKPNPEGPPR